MNIVCAFVLRSPCVCCAGAFLDCVIPWLRSSLRRKSMLESRQVLAAGSKPSRGNKQTSECKAAAPRKQQPDRQFCFFIVCYCFVWELMFRNEGQYTSKFNKSTVTTQTCSSPTAQVICLAGNSCRNGCNNYAWMLKPSQAVHPFSAFLYFSFCQDKMDANWSILFQIMTLIRPRRTTWDRQTGVIMVFKTKLISEVDIMWGV